MRLSPRFLLAMVPPLVLAASALALATGCGGSSPPKPAAAGPLVPASDAGAAAPPGAAEAPVAHPFAKTAAEVTSMIDDAIEAKRSAIMKCVEESRKRTGDPRGKVSFDLGIDQEGALMGVKAPKGTKEDVALSACVRDALSRAAFPRSNAGVVTVKKTFSDELVYPK